MRSSFLFSLLLPALLLCQGGCSVLVPHDTPVAEPLIHSVAEADQAERRAVTERASAELTFQQSEVLCYQKFFVNSCLDDAREVRRAALAPVRAAEVAAARFKREASVQQRDRELAEADVAYQAKLKQAIIDAEAKPAAVPVVEAEAPVKATKPALTVEQRAASHALREKQAAARQKERAARHAENLAAQEAKRKESEERVRRVEEKKAAKTVDKTER